MAGKPDTHPMAADSQATETPGGEPRYVEDMTLVQNGGSVRVTIPVAARKFLGYETGETRRIQVHDGGIWIPKEAPEDA